MMTVEQMVSVVHTALPLDRTPTEVDINDVVLRILSVLGASDELRAEVTRIVLAQRVVKMDPGFAIVERGDHQPWVAARKAGIDPFYWYRFERWLYGQGWPPAVVTGLGKTTDEILDLLGDPTEPKGWKRRGLVMGEVQSGKTATYSALTCKAADAGYKFIILLTGTLENLRRQTQERLDQGFVGFDSSRQLRRNGKTVRVGVGEIDKRRAAMVFTSSEADFRAATLDNLGFGLDALNEPALVVIKKNTRILANLRDWIAGYNTEQGGAKIDHPMLMIDDEADNASVNTNAAESDPTKTNAGIREILSLFRRSTYVGFTATPFANIFVDPDATEEMIGDDLFPQDFIYALQAPTNYFGPQRVFVDDEGSQSFLRRIDDAEAAIPSGHKSDFQPGILPPSLLRALHQFLVINAIRDLRGDRTSHRSMLVNVSRFTKVQDQVETLLQQELSRIQTDVRNFSSLPACDALQSKSIAALHGAWRRDFEQAGFGWPAVFGALHDAIQPVRTVAVNQRTGSRALDYRAHKKSGLRVIAVGGNSLSRGLTLEGLVISYFRRNSQMYDTLLQMGRWFGYRDKYEDLCRVWLPQQAIDWYGHISDATDELRADIRRMYEANLTPADFGLRVRSHPDALLVTARNKMRTAKEIVRIISISGQGFESVELPTDVTLQEGNWDAVTKFVADLALEGTARSIDGGHPFYRGVPRLAVSRLLRKFHTPETDMRFQPVQIADLLDSMDEELLAEWDVVIPGGNGSPARMAGVDVACQLHKVRTDKRLQRIVVSGSKRRVGSRGIEKSGLTPDQKRQAELKAQQEHTAGKSKRPNVADRHYRMFRKRPLLLLHLMETKEESRDNLDLGEVLPSTAPATQLAALGLSFPEFDDAATARRVKYRINLVALRELFQAEADDDEADEATA